MSLVPSKSTILKSQRKIEFKLVLLCLLLQAFLNAHQVSFLAWTPLVVSTRLLAAMDRSSVPLDQMKTTALRLRAVWNLTGAVKMTSVFRKSCAVME